MSARYDCADTQQRDEGLVAATSAVNAGQLVVLPTDTVYGVGADAFNTAAVAALLAAKGRGRSMPPPVLVGSVRAAAALWSGADGLDAIRAVEHADVQGTPVFWIFAEEAGWRDTTNHKDLARKDRFVTAVWPGE